MGPSFEAEGSSRAEVPIFGVPVAGAVYQKRPAAYAIVHNPAGELATIRLASSTWLPGGRALPGEAPEDTVVREVREEFGRQVRLLGRVGQAIQYFHAANEGVHYEMHAVFFRAEFVGEPVGPAEYEVCWLAGVEPEPPFYHACHGWAVCRACEEGGANWLCIP